MSDHWEVVGGQKKKPKGPKPTSNGEIPGVKWSSASTIPGAPPVQPTKKPGKKIKHKGPREYKIARHPQLESDSDDETRSSQPNVAKKDTAKSQKKVVPKQQPSIRKEPVETVLKKVPQEELLKFFSELKSAGSTGDVYLSWIKYSADALNTRLSSLHVANPDFSQFPSNLFFPQCPNKITEVIHQIIGDTVEFNEKVDVVGLSYSSLLAAIPTLIQRGDAGWGYLIFLRELTQLYPELPIRRSKTISELLESYANQKEIGYCILWVVSQSALFSSDHILKIAVTYLLPYYNFKHYKSFVLSALNCISSNISNITNADAMGGGESKSLIEPDQFLEFFEAAFDPKRRRDFESFYVAIRNVALSNINGRGGDLFMRLLPRLGAREFMPMSHQGKETFDILNGCLANDNNCFDVWKRNISRYAKETALLLNYLSKHAESVSYSKQLESSFIQSDEFANAAVGYPELLRCAKKLQTGIKRVEASRKSLFPWKWGCFLLLVTIIALLWLDVAENGKGLFSSSKTGLFLQSYGLLDEAEYLIDQSRKTATATYKFAGDSFGSFIAVVRPMLQTVETQAELYIPQVLEYGKIVTNVVIETSSDVATFFQKEVFVGALAPENLRKTSKDILSTIWTIFYSAAQSVYGIIEKYLH